MVKEQKNNVDGLTQDPLLECLVYICKLEQKEVSRSSLTASLPLVKGKLSPELYIRSAARAGLKAAVVKRALPEISTLVLPCVAIMADNKAVVIRSLQRGKQIVFFDPLSQRESAVTYEVFQKIYSGLCLYSKPDFNPEPRIEHAGGLERDHWFWGTLARSWKIYRDVLIASFMINIFVIANPLFVMNVYDRVVPNNALETLWALALGILCLYVFDFILRLLRTYFIEVAGKKSDILLSATIMERVLGAHFSQHPQSVGAFASRVREFDTIRNFITSATVSTFVDIPFVLLFMLVVAYVGGPIVWIPIVAIPLILLYSWLIHKKLRSLVSQTFAASAQKNATLVEALANLEAVKTLGAESKILHKWEASVGMLAYWGVKSRVLSMSATTFSAFVQQVASVFVVIVGVYGIAENALTLGALIASVILVSRALAPLAQISGLLVQYHQTQLALGSIQEIIETEQERHPQKKFIERSQFRGDIEFRDVAFTYPEETLPVLDSLSFKITAGEKVGVVGRIGSGKSTIHKLLIGLYRPDSGAILVDGIDISQLDPAELRSHLGCVPQDGVLFYGSIRDNIAYHNSTVSDEEIIRVAEIAGVSSFVNKHAKGFDRVVSERGESLSGGQRQAINIARGLVLSPPIVLLDEPSSSIDNASESQLLEKLQLELENKTVILVTHKTHMLNLVDRIIVINAGKIVADGEKSKVLDALKKGLIRV